MPIIDDYYKDLYVPGRIKAIQFPEIILETESGEEVTIETTAEQKNDPLFWQSIKDIWQAKIWVPFNVTMKQLRDGDWMMEPATTEI